MISLASVTIKIKLEMYGISIIPLLLFLKQNWEELSKIFL